MKDKLFNNLLLFSLFGVALYFFGILYEGIVYGPRLLDTSMESMLFWKNFSVTISPVLYYVPWVYLATFTLAVLYFIAPKEKPDLKTKLKRACIFQIASLGVTIYILTQINLKMIFGNMEQYAGSVSDKVILFNILSVVRLILGAIGLTQIFRAVTTAAVGMAR